MPPVAGDEESNLTVARAHETPVSTGVGPQGRRVGRPRSNFDLSSQPQQGQRNAVNALLASEVFPARSTAFTVNVLSPCAVA
jgi:hypothetical protein